MRDYSKEFGQTNKTILFERFSETDVNGMPKDSLLNLLNEDTVTKDETYVKVMDKLGVRSFKDFVRKFVPCVYCYPKSEGMSYELRKNPEYPDIDPTVLNSDEFYDMLMELYDRRKRLMTEHVNFDYKSMTDLLTPQRMEEKIKQIANDMDYNWLQLQELERKNPGLPSEEKEMYQKHFEDARLQYKQVVGKGLDGCLPLLLNRAYNQLLEAKEHKSDKGNTGNDESVKYVTRRVIKDDGTIEYVSIEAPKPQKFEDFTGQQRQLLEQKLHEDFLDCAPDDLKNEVVENAILDSISKSHALVQVKNNSIEVINKKMQNYESEYKKTTESKCKSLAPIIEKFLGVKAFFDNATSKATGELTTSLIIANCTARELVDCKKDELLGKFLDHVNKLGKNRKNKFWFAIIPGIDLQLNGKKNDVLVDSVSAKLVMDVCAQSEVAVFYNYKADKTTCFANLDNDVYKKIKRKIDFTGDDPLDGRYAICCLPNFTILPQSQTTVILNQKLYDNGAVDEYSYITLPGIYVDAAYVAAGMVVGSQDLLLLQEEKGLKVDRKLTGVRVDFEDKVVQKNYPSVMSKEQVVGINDVVEDDMNKTKFGFCFSDNPIYDDRNHEMTNCFVVNARTMREINGKYDKITNVLFSEFVKLAIYRNRSAVSSSEVAEFQTGEYRTWQDYIQNEESLPPNRRTVNALLKMDAVNKNNVEELRFPEDTSGEILIKIKFLHDSGAVKISTGEVDPDEEK